MTLSYYIYYRVEPPQAEKARAAVTTIQIETEERIGIRGRLLQRRDDETTWMEVYEEVEDGPALEATLAERVKHHGLERLLAPGSKRKLEVFRPAPPCA